jgi:hypothetical protein
MLKSTVQGEMAHSRSCAERPAPPEVTPAVIDSTVGYDTQRFLLMQHPEEDMLSVGGADEDDPGVLHVDAFLRAHCGLLGMTSTAIDGWAVLHRSPTTAMSVFFIPQACTLSVILILVTGVDFMRLHVTLPLVVAYASHFYVVMPTCLY